MGAEAASFSITPCPEGAPGTTARRPQGGAVPPPIADPKPGRSPFSPSETAEASLDYRNEVPGLPWWPHALNARGPGFT